MKRIIRDKRRRLARQQLLGCHPFQDPIPKRIHEEQSVSLIGLNEHT